MEDSNSSLVTSGGHFARSEYIRSWFYDAGLPAHSVLPFPPVSFVLGESLFSCHSNNHPFLLSGHFVQTLSMFFWSDSVWTLCLNANHVLFYLSLSGHNVQTYHFYCFFDVHFWHIKCAFYRFIRALQDTHDVDTSMHTSCKGTRLRSASVRA